jgi:hypothetical protein
MSLRTESAPVLQKLDRRRALFVLTQIDEICLWEQRKEGERGHEIRGAWSLPVRGTGWTILAAGKFEVVRRVPGTAFSGIEKEGVLPDDHPRALWRYRRGRA